MKVSRELEIKYNLERALQHTDERRIERAEPIRYEEGDLARKIGDVIALAKTYSFGTIGEFDAFLRLYNVTVEQIDTDKKRGLAYSILKNGQRIGRPMIATQIHGASLSAIESCIKHNTESARKAAQIRFFQKISAALKESQTYDDFKIILENYSVRVVDRNFSYSNLQKSFFQMEKEKEKKLTTRPKTGCEPTYFCKKDKYRIWYQSN